MGRRLDRPIRRVDPIGAEAIGPAQPTREVMPPKMRKPIGESALPVRNEAVCDEQLTHRVFFATKGEPPDLFRPQAVFVASMIEEPM